MRQPNVAILLSCVSLTCVSIGFASEPTAQSPVAVPAGFHVQAVASPPLVERPMFAALDVEGRLYVLDSGGVNGNDRGQKPPDVIRRLTDTDGDGVYDKSVIFADEIVFGTGLACYDNAIFITSPPSLWRLEDTTGDGVADQRTELVTGFAFNQSCTDDLHGACLGPDGRIYFLPGRFSHKVHVPSGPVLREGLGPWLMRCRPDGRDVEFVGGAVGNPVEVTFLPSGDAFLQGTFWAKPSAEDGLRDALIHAVLGGEYSVRDRDYTDRIRTGDFLPALVPLTATAPSGLTTYQSDSWGEAYQHNLFTTHFNTGRILRHRLSPLGATFTVDTEDFATAIQGDVHWTDVLEDGAGDLLLVNTGGWFRACCPASGSSKPEVKGAIYRVSRKDVPLAADPFGNDLSWKTAKISELIPRLADSRVAVRERAIEALSKRGNDAIAALSEVLRSPNSSTRQRLNALWTLCRIDHDAARDAGRIGLSDPAEEVRQVAANTAALHRDRKALQKLLELLQDPSLAVRREAANALGRIGHAEAVPHLLQAIGALSRGSAVANDRFLEHALIFAIISINDPGTVQQGLHEGGFAERRAALLALDQMPRGKLTANDVAPLLAIEDQTLQQTATDILLRHPQWTAESIQLIDGWLGELQLDESRRKTLIGMVRALRSDPSLRGLLDRSLANQESLSTPAREALLLALAQSGMQELAPNWKKSIAKALKASDHRVKQAALQAVEGLSIKELADDVHRVAADSSSDTALRLAALRSLACLELEFRNQEFEFLLLHLSPETLISERLTAFDVISKSKHDNQQLRALLPLVPAAGPIELPALMAAFSHGADVDVGLKLIEAIASSPVNPPPEIIDQSLRNYGEEVKAAAQPLLERLKKSTHAVVARLNELEAVVNQNPSHAERGRELFFGKAQCHLCHTVSGRGGKIGPDLSTIGDIRSRRDLLEAIVFPSATFARGFEPLLVTLNDGRLLTGLAGRESADELVLMVVRENNPVEVPIRRDLIEEVQIGRVSTMPNGLELQLKPQELSDLIGYLQQLHRSNLSTKSN